MSRSGLDGLERELPVELERHAPIRVDGVEIGATLRPASGEELSGSLRALGRLGLSALAIGAGRHLSLGNPPTRADCLLATGRLAEVDVCEPREGVCHAGAGVPLARLRARVAEAGWELPLDAPDESTLGGALAAGVLGPRCQGFGAPRDAVLGLEVVLGSGERTRCGGRVVKNVTGYDLAKLYVGSLGTLGVIEGAWLRLRPRPEAVSLLAARFDELSRGLAFARAASRRASARACVLLGARERGYECLVELAGDEVAVAHDAGELPADAVTGDRLAEAVALQSAAGPGDLVVRIAALPSGLAVAAPGLAAAGAELALHPGLRLLWARWRSERSDEPALASRLAAAGSAARDAAGSLRVESAPPSTKQERDVFGVGAAEVGLSRALKSRFDPRGTLAPGRAPGRT
jgi:glycolate oxidase FAD binding subunit